MKAVFRHELSSYFTGMAGYVFGAFLLLFAGIYTMVINLNAGQATFEYVLSNMSFVFLVAKEDVESVRNSAEMVLESLEEAEDSAEE